MCEAWAHRPCIYFVGSVLHDVKTIFNNLASLGWHYRDLSAT